MKILIADSFSTDHVAKLEASGHDCVHEPGLTAADLEAGALRGYDALVVRSTKVTAPALRNADRLALVVRAGAGYNTIDWQAAADRSIYVANTPGQNAVAVAELTIGLITALDRRIPDAVADLKAGRWRKSTYAKAQGLAGRRLGIIGMGSIGMAVAARARAMEMDVLAVAKPGRHLRTVADMARLGCSVVADLPALLAVSDIVTIHVPAHPSTQNMVDADFLDRMQDGAYLINTSRGDVVDEDALLAAIERKGLLVGLDVYRDEPAAGEAVFESPLASHPNVYGTHHIGASTEQAQRAIADAVVGVIDDFERGIVKSCVNLSPGIGTAMLTVRHRNQIGVLAGVLGALSSAGLNVEAMENRVFAGDDGAVATIHLSGQVTDTILDTVTEHEAVYGVSLVAQ